MLYKALSFLTSELNEYLGRTYQLTEDRAVLAAHVGPDGAPVTGTVNKVSVSLVNLAPEATVRNLQPERSGNGELRLSPAIKLNLWVMFAASFSDYDESLKFLSSTLAFFQGRPVFTPQNSPRLDSSFNRLVLELETLSYGDLSHLWGILGSKYSPSAVYKVRLVTIQDGAVLDRSPAIGGLALHSASEAAA